MTDPAPEEQTQREQRRQEEEHPLSYCPVCSGGLEARSCKLVCVSCGYYMSCSDFI